MTMFTNHLGQPIGRPLPDWKVPPFPGGEPMVGRFCRLEPLSPSRHGPEMLEAHSEDSAGRTWTYLPYGPFATPDHYLAWLQSMAEGKDPLFFAIVDQVTGKAVGLASYLRIDPKAGSIEVGHLQFTLRMQRTPIGTEAMYGMMRRAFELGYRRYEWKCDTLNGPSRAAAERLGFQFEGIFRQATVVKGRSRDTAWYSVIDSEWPAVRGALEGWLAPENFDERGLQRRALSEFRPTQG